MADTYQDKMNRIYTALKHQEPDCVPILTELGTFAIGYSNGTVAEMEADWHKEVEYYCKPFKDGLYTDAIHSTGCVFDSKLARIIGSEGHFTSEDGQTVQHKEQTPMLDDEYDKLIADPEDFLFNVCLPRTAKKLALPYPQNKAAIMEFIGYLGQKQQAWGAIAEKYMTEYPAVVMLPGIFAYPAMDIIFDYLRGFKGISLDLRRQPEKLLAGIDAIQDFAMKFMGIPDNATNIPAYPPYATMMHVPTFIQPKQFEKFFLPTYEKMLRRIHECGGKVYVFLEGSWENKADWFNSLPKDFMFAIVDADDMFKMKKLIGNNICLIGGMPLHTLKYGTIDQCKNIAKKLIDECAQGGGYIFSSSEELLSKNDLNFDNFVATHNFVHEYGKK